jgi:crotonobetainyl-CoA:carnitine CoA-transferase CaiB-like acyl-CoA transferase
VSSLVNQASNYLMAGKVPERIGSLHPNIAPYGELFTTKDGKTITFAIGSNRHFQELCSYLGLPELPQDVKFKTVQGRVKNRLKLFHFMEEKVKEKEANAILEHMILNNIPAGIIKNLKDVFKTNDAKKLIREEKIAGVETKRVSSIAFKTN